MKFEEFKKMDPYQQEMILILERIAKSLEKIVEVEDEIRKP